MKKQTIVLGITGGIAVFKSAQLTSDLVKQGYNVQVIMTKNATEFMSPLTFETLTNNRVITSMFEPLTNPDVEHIAIAKQADVFVVVPATANVIAKLAHGIADDMLTTTFLACKARKIVCPAMNTAMYENPITQENLQKLVQYDVTIVQPDQGFLACKDVGKGKLANLFDIMDAIKMELQKEKPLKGKKVLVSAGPTCEHFDPVRFISNHSSGKMGYQVAWWARALGAEVSLIHGPSMEKVPYQVKEIKIESAKEMFAYFQNHFQDADIIVKAAAVGDYAPSNYQEHKIKKSNAQLHITLEKNPDILQWLGEHKQSHQCLVGFAMETQNLMEAASQKCKQKNCDIMIANQLNEVGAGFAKDTNVVTILKGNESHSLECMSKFEVSKHIWDAILDCIKEKENIHAFSD